MYKPKQGLQVSEGLTRTLARKILDRKKIQIPKGQDPINVFTDIFGESINDVKNLADEMVEIDQAGGGMKNMDEMLEAEGLYDIEIPESPQRGLSKEEIKEKDPNLYDLLYGEEPDEKLQRLIKEEDVKSEADEDYLRKIIDPEEPEDFATGGRVGYGKGGAVKKGIKALVDEINKKFGKGTIKLGKDVKRPESSEMREAFLEFKKRQGFAYGSGKKLVQVLKTLGTDLKKEIKKAVDDLIPSGDPKLDADMAVDNMLEDLNIDRDAIDQYDILDAYGLAYDELKQPLLKEIQETKSLAPKMTERFELKQKYPGIDDKLLTQIIDDPDPQRKAEVLATIDQAFELMRQGKSQEEVYDIMKQMTDRTKQASGGLNYLSGF